MNTQRKPGRPARKSNTTAEKSDAVENTHTEDVKKYTLAEAIDAIQKGKAKIFRNDVGDRIKIRSIEERKIVALDKNNCLIGASFAFAAIPIPVWEIEQ